MAPGDAVVRKLWWLIVGLVVVGAIALVAGIGGYYNSQAVKRIAKDNARLVHEDSALVARLDAVVHAVQVSRYEATLRLCRTTNQQNAATIRFLGRLHTPPNTLRIARATFSDSKDCRRFARRVVRAKGISSGVSRPAAARGGLPAPAPFFGARRRSTGHHHRSPSLPSPSVGSVAAPSPAQDPVQQASPPAVAAPGRSHEAPGKRAQGSNGAKPTPPATPGGEGHGRGRTHS